jgi:hypothetical protein
MDYGYLFKNVLIVLLLIVIVIVAMVLLIKVIFNNVGDAKIQIISTFLNGLPYRWPW